MFAGTEVVERVHVAPGNRILRRNAQHGIALPLQIVPCVFRKNPIWAAEISRLRTGNRLDRLRATVYVIKDPLLPTFTLRSAQFDVAVGVVLYLVSVVEQSFGRIDAGDADILLGSPFAPGLGCESPADNKERGLHPIAVEHFDKARPRRIFLATEQHIGAGPVVEGESNELVSRERGARREQQEREKGELIAG